MIERVGSSANFVHTYQTTWHHITEKKLSSLLEFLTSRMQRVNH